MNVMEEIFKIRTEIV